MLSTSRLLGLACLLTAPLAPGAAQGWIEPIRPLPAFPRGAIAKVRSAVQVTLTGRAAHVTVEEWFRNSGPVLDEGNYLYPLRSEEHTSELQSLAYLVCRLLLEKKKKITKAQMHNNNVRKTQ